MQKTLNLVSLVRAEVADKGQRASLHHANRMVCVTGALLECLRSGNLTQYNDAHGAALSASKGTHAKAYVAAFTAVPAPSRITKEPGKLSPDNAAKAEAEAARLAQVWSDAFVAVMPLTVAEKTETEKAEAKAAKDAKARTAAEELARQMGWAPVREVTGEELVSQVCELIGSGQLAADDFAKLSKAVDAAKQAARTVRKAQEKVPA